MAGAKRPHTPVKPAGMELIFLYPCPECTRSVPLVAPLSPSVARCDGCGQEFPVIPADAKAVEFVKIMMANGKAGIDPDFL